MYWTFRGQKICALCRVRYWQKSFAITYTKAAQKFISCDYGLTISSDDKLTGKKESITNLSHFVLTLGGYGVVYSDM